MRDAAMFPFYASGALFGLYIVFKVCIINPFNTNVVTLYVFYYLHSIFLRNTSTFY